MGTPEEARAVAPFPAGFSPQWEQIYRQGGHNSLWPWSDLVSYVMRYARPARPGARVLELGCGAGANIPFFLGLDLDYCGTDGSATAIERLQRRFGATAKVQLACCDFTAVIPFSGPFDLVVDRSSLTHNGTAAIRSCLRRVAQLLRPGASFIGIDWFSTASAVYASGTELEDPYTRHFNRGEFAGLGAVHFSDEAHLRSLFADANLSLERLEHKEYASVIPAGEGQMGYWQLLAVRP